MKQFSVTFVMTGRVAVQAETKQEAVDLVKANLPDLAMGHPTVMVQAEEMDWMQ